MFFVSFCLSCILGCVSSGQIAETKVASKQIGVYHKVKTGETLWRISQAYKVGIDEIVGNNNIENASVISKGQVIFIPGAKKTIEIIIRKDDPNEKEFAWPIRGKVIGYFGKIEGQSLSKGIKIRPSGETIVTAARKGKVVFSDYLIGNNYMVIIDHYDGYYSVYAKNAKNLVKLNDLVYKGDKIADVGGSGGTGYLHFEIRRNGIADNPLYYLQKL